MNVGNPSVKKDISFNTREPTQERNHLTVMSVEKLSPRSLISVHIKQFTQQRNPIRENICPEINPQRTSENSYRREAL